MTAEEFSREFDIQYNSIATKDNPGIDLYEKSVYLTRAQLEIVKNYFDPKSNRKNRGFEQSSKRRNDLSELVRNYKTTLKIDSDEGMDDNSQFFKIPNKSFLIVQEKAKVISDIACIDDTYLKVIPKTHDEYNDQIDSPFKQPGNELIWRIDYYSQNGSNKNVELISPHTIVEYRNRYVVYPSPIVLTDLLTEFPGENLSVDGVTQKQTCKLSESVHREILDRAVELALIDYEPRNINAKVQMNNRNE